ncbi:hypothetical protein Scel_03760 [Streptomyces cellostaticus]|nr:hypothetical protein Scel_03760 [Streptomyces cellostaticus]
MRGALHPFGLAMSGFVEYDAFPVYGEVVWERAYASWMRGVPKEASIPRAPAGRARRAQPLLHPAVGVVGAVPLDRAARRRQRETPPSGVTRLMKPGVRLEQ